MKTECKALEKSQVELTVVLEAGEAKKVIKNVENAFVREVKIPGFRPGKAPLGLVRKDYSDAIEVETRRAVFQRNIAEAIKSAGVKDVAIVEVKDISCTDEGGGFTAIIDVWPTFDLPVYKGLKIEERDTTVTDEAVSGRIEALRAAYCKFEEGKEGDAVADGDYVQIDYSGSVDGKPIAEIAPEAKIVAAGTGFWFVVEEGRFLPEIVDGVKGMKAGETKEISAKFDSEAAPEPLKGVSAVYSVAVKALRRRVLPDDAELVAKAKIESMEKLRESTRAAMQRRADEDEKTRRENEAVEQLLSAADFAVPGSQVSRVTDDILRRLSERAQYSGLDADYFEKNRDKIRSDAETSAVRQVRLWYILDAIAKAENIDGKEGERNAKAIDFVLASSVK